MTEKEEPDATEGPPPLPRLSPAEPLNFAVVIRPSEPERIGLFASVESPRMGEDSVLEVCQRLVDHLKNQGIKWDRPTIPDGPESGVDCICGVSENIIKIQVTRALRDSEYFATLGKHKAAIVYTTASELAQGLWGSIKHKADRTSESDRRSITLVLDASEIHIPNDSETLELFATEYQAKAEALGFNAIWLVGCHSMFVTNLAASKARPNNSFKPKPLRGSA